MSKQNLNPYAYLSLRTQIYMESRAMAEYALAKGKTVSASVIKTIEAFEDHTPSENNEIHTVKVNAELDVAALVDAHDFLARLIEPATPQTVLLLDMEQENDSLLNFLGPVALVRQLMLAALISLFIFVGLLASPYITTDTLADDVLATNGVAQLARLFFYLSAAALGASFAALYKANSFISMGTYDPCYHASYWIRFTLGIIAGLLLALLISEKSIQNNELLSEGVIRPLLAILGGFSADLLYTFLNRMEETFKSLFEANTKTLIDAKAQEAKAKLLGLEVEGRMKLAQDLMLMQQKIDTAKDPEAVKQQINELMQNLMQANRVRE